MVSEQHGYNLFLLSEVIKTFFVVFAPGYLFFSLLVF